MNDFGVPDYRISKEAHMSIKKLSRAKQPKKPRAIVLGHGEAKCKVDLDFNAKYVRVEALHLNPRDVERLIKFLEKARSWLQQ